MLQSCAISARRSINVLNLNNIVKLLIENQLNAYIFGQKKLNLQCLVFQQKKFSEALNGILHFTNQMFQCIELGDVVILMLLTLKKTKENLAALGVLFPWQCLEEEKLSKYYNVEQLGKIHF